MTPQTADELFAAGVDVITSGNHIWDKREIRAYLEANERVLRPANYPPGTPGHGSTTVTFGDVTVGVVNVMGRVFMPPVDDPFRVASDEVEQLHTVTNVILVDMHAEATSEKMAMGRYLDGRVSFVYGTHTHVQTSDEQILAGGTAYITDVGMTGPTDGIIGMDSAAVIERFTSAFAERFSVVKHGMTHFCAAVVNVDRDTGRALDIKRIYLRGLA